ncbi:MAG: hypothetical protein R3F65_30900 [bacterium]
MIFTTITNGEGDAMRQLERKESGTAPKTPAKTDKAKKTSSMAQLVLANGDLGEAGRIGVALIGAGVTATTIGMLEGLARRGRAKWWSELSATQRSLIMITIVIVAGFIARHRRKGGHVKSAAALEAAAVAAWAMAVAYITEEGVTRFPVGSKDGGSTGALGLDELKALDKQIDDDIRNAARRLRELAETEREERARQAAANDTSEASEAMGLLSYHEGAADDDEDDDEDLF